MIKAGISRKPLRPRVGTDLIGYKEQQHTTAIHDSIHARALVLDDGQIMLALCSIEICILPAALADAIRQAVAAATGIPAANIHLFTTHTHAAPALHDPVVWEQDPIAAIIETITEAYRQRQEASVGFGFGLLYGYSINRRWMNRPIDPSVGVMRVDAADGRPLAILSNFGNHAVVLGSDNDQVSGDWPGYSSRHLEAAIGGDCVALFSQGGAGDINPLTESLRQRLNAGHPMKAIGDVTTLYGGKHDSYNIEDRRGGTFLEAETIALAYNAEVQRVWQAINTTGDVELWNQPVIINAAPTPDEPPVDTQLREQYRQLLPDVDDETFPMEIMLVGIGPAILTGQPGETFSEDAIHFRRVAQQMGWAYPWLISYANGWYSYLVPEGAHAEGGYEVDMARAMGLSTRLQARILDALLPHLQRHIR